MDRINIKQWKLILKGAAETVIACEAELNHLDSLIGDGDHGTSMRRGFEAVKAAITETNSDSVPKLFHEVGMTLVQKVGGASGPILGYFFIGAGKAAAEVSNTGTTEWAAMFHSGVNSVQTIGRGKPGCKSMLDALYPAAEALSAAVQDNASLDTACRMASEAARRGADETEFMIAKYGRAKFLGERSLGHQDPGANTIALFLQAIADQMRVVLSQ